MVTRAQGHPDKFFLVGLVAYLLFSTSRPTNGSRRSSEPGSPPGAAEARRCNGTDFFDVGVGRLPA